jgi:hypothetical protein
MSVGLHHGDDKQSTSRHAIGEVFGTTLKKNASLKELEQLLEWLRRVFPQKQQLPEKRKDLIAHV